MAKTMQVAKRDISIRVDETILEVIDLAASGEGRSRANYIRQLIEKDAVRYMKKNLPRASSTETGGWQADGSYRHEDGTVSSFGGV